MTDIFHKEGQQIVIYLVIIGKKQIDNFKVDDKNIDRYANN